MKVKTKWRSLDALIVRDGLELLQVRRAKNVAIYRRPDGQCEVVVVRHRPGVDERGRPVAVEYYPEPVEAGTWLFHCRTMAGACLKMAELLADGQKPVKKSCN